MLACPGRATKHHVSGYEVDAAHEEWISAVRVLKDGGNVDYLDAIYTLGLGWQDGSAQEVRDAILLAEGAEVTAGDDR